jgi:hypothetical protein
MKRINLGIKIILVIISIWFLVLCNNQKNTIPACKIESLNLPCFSYYFIQYSNALDLEFKLIEWDEQKFEPSDFCNSNVNISTISLIYLDSTAAKNDANYMSFNYTGPVLEIDISKYDQFHLEGIKHNYDYYKSKSSYKKRMIKNKFNWDEVEVLLQKSNGSNNLKMFSYKIVNNKYILELNYRVNIIDEEVIKHQEIFMMIIESFKFNHY